MRILFLTIGAVYNFNNSGTYTDLLKKFAREGHEVYVVGAVEKRNGKETQLVVEYGINILRVKVGNITKTNLLEKGISTLTIGKHYQRAINKYWLDVSFDLILYTTPPITIAGLVTKLKKKYNAYTYLLLKDIFPQNAIDIEILRKTGWRGLIYRYFKRIEKKLYKVSDKIGCMSPANVKFVKCQNKEIPSDKLEICPNTIDVIPEETCYIKEEVLKEYNLPKDKFLLLYGGNFGKPQNVEYIIEAIEGCKYVNNIHFVLCGSGTDFGKIESYMNDIKPKHVTVIQHLPYEKYAQLVSVCDVGLLFLDYRFTIPNFPSRLLDYMNHELPVIAATDANTDVGKTIVDGAFGWWCESKKPDEYVELIQSIFMVKSVETIMIEKSKNARKYLKNNFETNVAYNCIVESYEKSR